MEATEKSITIYNSVYRHGIDSKRRVQIPAKWRPKGNDVEFTVFVWPGGVAGFCLRVLPPLKVLDLLNEVEKMSTSDPKSVALRRLLGSKSDQLTVDKGGRICIPEWMADFAGIGRGKSEGKDEEVTLVGLLDRFEIWDSSRYAAVSAADEVLSDEAFKLI